MDLFLQSIVFGNKKVMICAFGTLLLPFKPLTKFRYIHSITGFEINETPKETGGGILADEMGLGKTLTILSAIIKTASEARSFALSTPNGTLVTVENTVIASRATLVVVPSPCKDLLEFLSTHLTSCSIAQRVAPRN